MKTKGLLVFAGSLVAVCMQAQVTTFHPGVTANGVTYALPRTVLQVDVNAIRTDYTPGEFARYAERYLHLQNVSTQPETRYSVQHLTLKSAGVPDSTKMYTVKLKDKTVAPLVQMTDDGILLAINHEDPVAETVTSSPQPNPTSHKLNSKAFFTEEILAATSTAKMAELTAAEIYEIRESRNTIMRGQADAMPKDGASLKIVIDRLNQQEEALMQLFVGYIDTTYVNRTFTINPEGDIQKQIVFRFSQKLGFMDADDLGGAPYYLDVKDQHSVPLPTAKEAAKRKISGIVYNLPGTAKVDLYDAERSIISQTLPIAQFGTIDQLALTLFEKKQTTKVTFHPATGGLIQLR